MNEEIEIEEGGSILIDHREWKNWRSENRGGAEAIGTIKDGDVVLARIKAGGDFVIEILGISEVGVWE